jgi:Pentapeptide repeats (8 copies)
MANRKHLALLRQDVAAWNVWRRTNPRVRPSLSGASLFGATLCGADLREANLRGADLSYADLRGANLSHANLAGADLYRATLSEANLTQTNLSYANLHGTGLNEADLTGSVGWFAGMKQPKSSRVSEPVFCAGEAPPFIEARLRSAALWSPRLNERRRADRLSDGVHPPRLGHKGDVSWHIPRADIAGGEHDLQIRPQTLCGLSQFGPAHARHTHIRE